MILERGGAIGGPQKVPANDQVNEDIFGGEERQDP